MEWSEFAWRLGRELAGLERDTILIVRERDESRHYVQAMREPDRLYAEAVSNNFLEGPLLLTLADEEVMSEAGWRPPSDPTPRNWWTELPEFGTPGGMRSVTEADFSRLADVMVTALRDVQGVRRPSDLVYESFHRHGTGLIELTDFGIDVADPSRVNKRRASSAGPPAASPGVPPAADALAGATPPPVGTPPAGTSMPLEGTSRVNAELLEPRLAEAKANGDNTTYFRLLANADLVLPASASAVEDPDRAEFPTISIGSSTYVTVFTSPGALARTGDRRPGLYRRTSFAQLASGWPDPTWRLAINWGLPSEVLLDSSVIDRLHGELHGDSRRTPPPVQGSANPYGTVDPTALAGPNPVAGEPKRPSSALNGSSASHAGHGPEAHDDSHTAIDPYSAADLHAALESGTPEPEASGPGASGGSAAGSGASVPNVPAMPSIPETPPVERAAPEPLPVEPLPAEPEPAPLGAPTNRPSAAREPTGVPLRPPHGTRLWHSAGEGDETPLAVYDAIGGAWTPVRADAVPAPRSE
ncbi:SseB family protein [Actinomadura decatromicini]|uniref:SseB family protein n=1 Tax=Actinomadura decatromicini TaxID=2604572 RepID=UPI001FE6F5F4|nr:SseB family protein [Actinomadura decatromicini]